MQGIALAGDSGASESVRLHISPFNPSLLDKIIPPSVQPLARDISFHTLQTSPEQGFGYVELPSMEAQKIKAKLNGSTLKGTKVRIEEARPERKRKSGGNDDEDLERKARKTEKKGKKSKEDGVIPGHELEKGRRVKRGWADKESTSKSSRRKDKEPKKADGQDASLDGKKLRFKTSLPANAVPVEENPNDGATKKKTKEGKKSKRKTVVEEFDHTNKLAAGVNQDTSEPPSSSYEDGRGWVNETGEVVEAEPSARSRRSKAARPESERRVSAIESRETDDLQASKPPEDTNEDEDMSVDAAPADSAVETETTKEVHPLEALFKRPANKSSASAKPRPQPIDTSFSFFEASAPDDGDMVIDMPPQTPHTKRDLEWRSIRSAAPTPDTAAIGRKFSFPSPGESEEDEDDEDAQGGRDSTDPDAEMADVGPSEQTVTSGGAQERGEESAFRKWFYENRGDFNRGWKKRRRDEKKAERQRENRRLSRKVA